MKPKKCQSFRFISKPTRAARYAVPSILALCATAIPAHAQDNSTNAAPQNFSARKAPTGLLPIPDYSGGFWSRSYLSGDWSGIRTDLANDGATFGAQWNQYVQGVAGGGRDQKVEYGGNGVYTANFDLQRMDVMRGALIAFRAESRYGDSVNRASGSILPVNTDAFFPLTSKPDQDIAITITDLNYTQFLSKYFGVFFGKLDVLSADPNEFASGRGTSQFMNFNFNFSPSLTLRLPYSTLGAGAIWIPVPAGPNGGITVKSMVINTADSSTTTGFEDFGKGQSWNTEADFQYYLGNLPGGMNVGGLWSFNQDFAHLGSQIVFQPGEGLSIGQKHSTWAGYWSLWQYLFSCDTERKTINLLNGQSDKQGIGLFARFGVADKDTNPSKWAASGGIGGRGVFPTRDDDTFGLGYYYDSIQTLRISSPLELNDFTQGFEAFYNFALTPAIHVTLDVQVVDPVQKRIDVATVLGMRASIDF